MKRKKILILGSAAIAIAAMGALSFNTNNINKIVKAGELEYTIKWDYDSWEDIGGGVAWFAAYSSNHNRFVFGGSNATLKPGDNAMYLLPSNGSGCMCSSSFQGIKKISVTYKAGASGDLSLYVEENPQDYSGETLELVNGVTTKQTQTLTTINPSNCHYFDIWCTGTDAYIYEVSVTYTCA